MRFLKTDLAGKVKNLPDFRNEALLPLFEAVANSIHAIEELNAGIRGYVIIRIIRSGETSFDGYTTDGDDVITGFEIEDNGIGFDAANFESFLTAETTHKIKKGGKGVGRFFWLKAFSNVKIDSVYGEDDRRRRMIDFDMLRGITETEHKLTTSPRKTVVKLMCFKDEYRKLDTAYKTTKKIAQRILEHSLSYYIEDKAPAISVEDLHEKIFLDEMFDEIRDDIKTETLELGGVEIVLSHVRLYSTYSQMHSIVYCASGRDVKSVPISRVIGTSQQFDQDGRKFHYAVYVSSAYLDDHVDSSRLWFDIPEEREPMDSIPATMSEITDAVVCASKRFLSPYLESVKRKKEEVVANYVSTKDPTLRAVPKYCPEVLDEIEPNSPDDRIGEILYKHKGRAEYSLRKRGETILKSQIESIEEIEEEYRKVTGELEDFQKDQLAGYIIFRKMIIDILSKKLEFNTDGRYSNEEIIHDIIFPRKTNADEIRFEDHNMWLIDERLAFHRFAVSDRPISEMVDGVSGDRPDILVFSEIDDDRVARSVSLIELKRPQRKSFDDDPTRQLYRYVRQVRDSKVTLPNGRPLSVNDTTRFYCYLICDITRQIEEFTENNDYARLKGERGFYCYNRTLNTHTEIVAFDKLVVDAMQRHKAFFEKLGI